MCVRLPKYSERILGTEKPCNVHIDSGLGLVIEIEPDIDPGQVAIPEVGVQAIKASRAIDVEDDVGAIRLCINWKIVRVVIVT